MEYAQSLFRVGVPLWGDWVYEKAYYDFDDPTEIGLDLENDLFLLRLFKIGDLVFSHPRIREPNGNLLSQLPYRIMSQINTTNKYSLMVDECSQFDEFAAEILSHENWSSTWFQTSRRFFLYGGGKEFSPAHDQIDRIVDYMIAMESALVPESDFVGRRLRERAVLLISNHNIDHENAKRILKNFYDIRSIVVHGGNYSSIKSGVLKKSFEFETILRWVIIEAVRKLPFDDADRKTFLKNLFDVSDQARADTVLGDFCAIKDENEQKRCFNLMAKRIS